MRFDAFLTRADDHALQELLGPKMLRLLRAVDRGGFSQRRQRELLLEHSDPRTLLKQARTRRILLELLRPEEAKMLLRVIGSDVDEPYERLSNATFSGSKLDALLDFFELPRSVPADMDVRPDASSIAASYGLFAHQAKAARGTLAALNSEPRRLLLHMPTGAGKTRTAMHVVSRYMTAEPSKAVVWLAHSEELCDQAAEEFEKAWSFLGDRDVSVQRFWGAHAPDVSNVAGSFVVAGLAKTYATVRRSMGTIGRIGARTGLVVMDEAHQAIAPTYRLILDALVEPFATTGLLGLSATPGRSWDDRDADRELADFFKRRKVTLEVEGYANPVDFLLAEGYLARAEFKPLSIGSGLELTEGERASMESAFDIPPDLLERLAVDEMRNLAILSEIEHLAKRHQRVIVFATTVEHSDLLAYALRARGNWARSVTGSTPAADRASALQQFKSDDDGPRILCNYGVLTTGFDAPRTSAALIARPTKSLVLYSQMVGRATRGPRAGGNEQAEIVTVVDSGLPGFGDVGEAFYNWEDVWEDL